MKNNFLIPLLVIANLVTVAQALAQAPVIDREPYRKLYDINGDLTGVEFPDPDVPEHHPAPQFNFPTTLRKDASSLINAESIIHLAIDASGPGLSYQWKKGNTNLVNMNDGTRVIDGANGPELRVFPVTVGDFGIYRCVVSNSSGTVTSIPVRITVLDVFTPSTNIIAASSSATASLSVTVNSATAVTKFRWWKMVGAAVDPINDTMISDGGAFSGATKNVLKIKTPDGSNAGTYYCVVTAYNTFMYSGPKNLIVVPAPESRLVQLGAPLEFIAMPQGPAALLAQLTYQWRKDNAPLGSETNSTLSIASAQLADQGSYSVDVTHPDAGTVTSLPGTATVIDSSTAYKVVVQGKNGVFVVPVISKTQTFQWYRNGNPLAASAKYVGVTSAKFTVKATNVDDAGEYECRTTIGGDTVILSRPVLIVVQPPASKVVAVGGQLELEALHPYGGAMSVTPALFQYQWFKNKVLIPGAESKIYEIPTAVGNDRGAYTCMVTYPSGGSGLSGVANVTVLNTNPFVVNVNAGKSAKLSLKSVLFAGKNVSFQWKRDGNPLVESLKYVGVNKSSLTITGCSLADADDYECEVSYPGSSLSATVDLVVFSAPEIVNLVFPPAIVGGQFIYQIEFSPDPLYVPEKFAASPLPKGLTINKSTGLIEGVPTVSGSFDVLVTVTNDVGPSTETATLVVNPLPAHLVGNFVAPLPRMPAGQFADLGGRFDMIVTATGAASGKVTVGPLAFSFKGTISVIGTDGNATAEASLLAPRAGGDLTITFDLGTDDYLTDGEITGAGNTVPFEGWRNTAPGAGLQGLYNFAIGLTAGDMGVDSIPQGSGYGSFTVSPTGALNIAGSTSDGESITSASFVGPDGEIMFFQSLYKTVAKGSILAEGQIDDSLAGNPLGGEGTWSRPENPSSTHRRYKDGFGPVDVIIAGGLYAPGANLLGATAADLNFEEGGIELASRNPNRSFSVASGSTLPVPSSSTPALTVFKGVNLATGAFNGSASLADDDPTTPGVVKADEYKRTLSFKGLVVPIGGELVGYGFFVIPQIPTLAPPTTTSTSPELSGSVLFEKTAP